MVTIVSAASEKNLGVPSVIPNTTLSSAPVSYLQEALSFNPGPCFQYLQLHLLHGGPSSSTWRLSSPLPPVLPEPSWLRARMPGNHSQIFTKQNTPSQDLQRPVVEIVNPRAAPITLQQCFGATSDPYLLTSPDSPPSTCHQPSDDRATLLETRLHLNTTLHMSKGKSALEMSRWL